ncbi:hypothetical protein [Salinarimonas ramus]|nr:hypothetical protein [Salinarimonas ramus]
MNQTWREAIAAQAGERAEAVLAAFDSALADGRPEHVAAYEALDAHGLLAVVDLPGDPSSSPAQAEEAQILPDEDDVPPQNRSARNQ